MRKHGKMPPCLEVRITMIPSASHPADMLRRFPWMARILALAILLMVQPVAQRAFADPATHSHPVKGRCFAIGRNSAGTPHTFRLSSLHVLVPVAAGDPILLSPEPPKRTIAIACLRQELVSTTSDPSGDALVVKAGYPLYIEAADHRIGALYLSGDQFAGQRLTTPEVDAVARQMEAAPDDAAESSPDEIMKRAVSAPTPSCEPGHEGALANGVVTINPGQTVCVQLEVSGDLARAAKVVSSSEAGNTLILKLWEEPGTAFTYLQIRNPLGSDLAYEARLVRSGLSQDAHASTCPVLSSRSGFEYWDYPVSRLTMTNFKILPKSSTLQCQ